jgi:hypothetical protein
MTTFGSVIARLSTAPFCAVAFPVAALVAPWFVEER